MNSINSRCCYCRRHFDENSNSLKKTKDHFIPVSRGGGFSENILDCCKECNQWKSDRMPLIWLNRVEYFSKKRTLYGSYTLFDYRQIIGSIRHWIKKLKGKNLGQYKF